MAVLLQESLAQIGIKTTINKIPGANFRAALLKKDMPMIINRFGGWLNYPEYFFFWSYHGQNAVFNTMSYQNPAMDKLIDAAASRRTRTTTISSMQGPSSEGVRRRAAHPALPADDGRRDAEEHHRATSTGSTCSPISARSCKRLIAG